MKKRGMGAKPLPQHQWMTGKTVETIQFVAEAHDWVNNSPTTAKSSNYNPNVGLACEALGKYVSALQKGQQIHPAGVSLSDWFKLNGFAW
jgi:hypothetical protein